MIVEDSVHFSNWVKKLGQWHLSKVNRGPDEYTTLCGRPMLGNNYEADFMRSEKGRAALKPCKECHQKAMMMIAEARR